MATSSKTGHRKRLKERFSHDTNSKSAGVEMLELLLTYALPRRDVKPIAEELIRKFGGLEAVLGAPSESLCEIKGIKEHTSTLIKLVNQIISQSSSWKVTTPESSSSATPEAPTKQETLFETSADDATKRTPTKAITRHPFPARPRAGLFGKALLRDAIDLLPIIPDTESVDEVRNFIRQKLTYSAESTRDRYASYVTRRMFPDGYVDKAIRVFSKSFPGSQELVDICYYRFIKSEPVMERVLLDLFLPSIGMGRLSRATIRDYLSSRYPDSRSVKDCTLAIADALKAANRVTVSNGDLEFSYREPSLNAFAFVLHSEFPEPNIYALDTLEKNPAVRALLWDTTHFVTMLYELRNEGLVSKISEIDGIRQFTTRYELDELALRLAKRKVTQ